MALWGRAGREAAVCHAGCGVCAPVARGRERARAGRAADYREKMIRRGMNPDAFRFYLDTFRNGMPPRHRPGAYHRLLPRHRQRQGMLDVP